jgi:hypothetical protein
MEDAPAGIPSRCVDHLADLVVGKVVGNPSSTFSPMARLTQQEALQGFIQGVESVLRCKLGDLAELLKREVVAEDCPCYQEAARTSEGSKLSGGVASRIEGCGSNTQLLPSIKRGTRIPRSSSS